MTDLSGVRRAVEFGVGTGVYTRGMLDRLPPDAGLLAFEVDRWLAAAVAAKLRDPRLRVIQDSAENVGGYLGDEKADVIVSSIPFTTLSPPVRDAVLDAARRALAPGGAMLVLQYSPAALPHLRRRFSRVRRRFSPLNLPPAFLYACDDPRDGESP
jgi:phospholipid N-methyltransferase